MSVLLSRNGSELSGVPLQATRLTGTVSLVFQDFPTQRIQLECISLRFQYDAITVDHRDYAITLMNQVS
jgi:hypothetical protein